MDKQKNLTLVQGKIFGKWATWIGPGPDPDLATALVSGVGSSVDESASNFTAKLMAAVKAGQVQIRSHG